MFATPVYRDCAWQYTRALVDTCVALERTGIHHRAQFVVGNSNLPRARNELAAEFLASDCTDLLFIDSDMGWTPTDVIRLLASDKPLIGGVGRKKSPKPNTDLSVWCARFDPADGGNLTQDEFGAIRVLGVGTGFLKITSSVFETMIAAHPEWKRAGNDGMSDAVRANYYQFFRFDPDCPHETGEDYLFCQRWRELGGEVWIDPEIALTHSGSHEYRGSITEIFA
jgi:hypothetical protein